MDTSHCYNTIISPYSAYASQYSSTTNKCYLIPAPSNIERLVICRTGSVYDSQSKKCLKGDDSYLHFEGNDPEAYTYNYGATLYSSLSVEACSLGL